MFRRTAFSFLTLALCAGFLTGCGAAPTPDIEIAAVEPCEIESGATTLLSLSGNIRADTAVNWEASEGSFADPSAVAASYTAPDVENDTHVMIAVSVTDQKNVYADTIACTIIAPESASQSDGDPIPPEPTEVQTEAQPGAAISFPTDGATVGINIIVEGTYSDLPEGQSIWIAIRPHITGQYYFQSGPAVLSGNAWTNEAWIGSDTPDQAGQAFDLIVFTATPEAATEISAFLAECERNQDWPGQDTIIEGMTKQGQITITRQ